MKIRQGNIIYHAPSVDLVYFKSPENILASLSVVGELEDFEIGEDLG